MRFATETIVQAEADIEAALRMIQGAGAVSCSQCRVALLEQAVGKMIETAEMLSEFLPASTVQGGEAT